MRVFSLFVAFIFSAAGISALAVDDIDAAAEINNVSDTSIVSSDGGGLYSDISTDDQLNNNEDESEGDGEEKGDSDRYDMFAQVDDAQNATGEQAESDQAADTGQETTPSQQPQAAQAEQPDETVADDKPSRWSLYTEFWNEGKLEKGNWGTFMTIRPQYQLNDKLRLGYSFEFTVLWPLLGSAQKTTETSMGDHYLMLSSSTALGPFDLFGYMRIYLPTSKGTMAEGRIARVRIKPYFALPVSKDIKFVLRLETNYFQHTVDSFRGASVVNKCNSPQYCSDINESWRIEPMIGFMGKIYGPFSFESIHGFRFHSRFENKTVDAENQKPKHEVMWYNESGIIWETNIGGRPVSLLAGFYDNRKTGGSFWKRLPIVSYFTGPLEESFWVFSLYFTI